MTETHILPTYDQSIQMYKQPPSYHQTLVTNPEPYDQFNRDLVNEFLKFHQYNPLKFTPVTCQSCSGDELLLDYKVVSNEYIVDLKLSLEILIHDKLVQIERNSKFIKNNIKTLQTNYFIDKLRNTTLMNFNTIYERLQLELFNLDDLFNNYMKFNTQYQCILSSHLDYQSEKCNITMLNNLRHNLHLVREKIETLCSTSDISYILKERARIYNDAKQVIQNQRRSSASLNNNNNNNNNITSHRYVN